VIGKWEQEIDALGRLRLQIEALKAKASVLEATLLRALRRRDGWVPGRRFEARRVVREVLEPDPKKVARLVDFPTFLQIVKVQVAAAEPRLGRDPLRRGSTVSTVEALQVRPARALDRERAPQRNARPPRLKAPKVKQHG